VARTGAISTPKPWTATTALARGSFPAWRSVPLGEGKRAVLVRDTQQMDPEEQRKLRPIVADPAVRFLILHTGTPIVEDGKRSEPAWSSPNWLPAVKKAGRVEEFGLPRRPTSAMWAVRERGAGRDAGARRAAVLAQLSAKTCTGR
jgi:hypothetical protein